MTRASIIVVLFLSFSLAANLQAQNSADVGIDEKPGVQVSLDTMLRNETGGDVTLRQLVDKPTILMFNYFRCPSVCPVLINNMVEVVNQIQLEPGKDFRLIAISFDPTDTPELARQKKANYLNRLTRPFPPAAWHFLTGDAANVKAVADSAGFKYRKEGDMYAHPGAIMILTPKGIMSRYLYGTSFLTADVALAVQEAAGGKVRPTISRILSFCYSYDPDGRRYVFSLTRTAGAVVLIFAVVFLIFALRGRSKKSTPAA
jgi:protein SCO1/2